jgi:hypothetical protein
MIFETLWSLKNFLVALQVSKAGGQMAVGSKEKETR